ncbi:Hypothetical protein A7982_07182 [Minicystis rosea]|nr:Hypothetical protein A7982_07182 [Minicystis rosea]
MALSTTPIVKKDACESVSALYRAIALDAPATFRAYPSPRAALLDFPRWKGEVTAADSMPCYWRYQLPMCDPRSYFRQWGPSRDVVDLAVRRWPNANRCLAFSEPLPEPGSALSLPVHAQLWSSFDGLPAIDWVSAVIDDLDRLFPGPLDMLWRLADEHDPTCQIPVTDFIFLGPFPWMTQEVACASFCEQELGVRVNRALYDVLRSFLSVSGFVMTFDRLCILCDRPERISATSILFRDGYEVSLDGSAAPRA